MKPVLSLVFSALLICSLPARGQWLADPEQPGEVRAAEALEQYRSDPRLETYFAEAAGFAVYPRILRIGIGTGLAHGRGVVIVGSEAIGESVIWEFVHGLWGGVEVHSKIIFFRDEEALERFRRNQWQFQGRAGAAVTTVGGSKDSAFDRGVAVFTRTKGGLLVEAAVGAARYKFRESAEP